MRNPILGIVGLVVLLTYVSCTNIRSQLSDDIQDNQARYQALAELINRSDFSAFANNQYIAQKYFPDSLLEAINQTPLKNRVNYLIFNQRDNCSERSIELISGNLQLVFEPCPDEDFPQPGSYQKKGFIETWGISSHWFIWKDNDFL